LSLSGKTPCSKDRLWIRDKGAANKSSVSLMGDIERSSTPSHLLFFREWTIAKTSEGVVGLRKKQLA